MRALDVCDKAGITYRQLDYWTSNGWLHVRGCTGTAHDKRPCYELGSGNERDFIAAEVDVACRMGALVRAHIKPEFAAQVARHMVETGKDTCNVTLDGAPRLAITWLRDATEVAA